MAFCPGYAVRRAGSIGSDRGYHFPAPADYSDFNFNAHNLATKAFGKLHEFALAFRQRAMGFGLRRDFGIYAAGWDTTSEITTSIERRTASLGGNRGKRGGPP